MEEVTSQSELGLTIPQETAEQQEEAKKTRTPPKVYGTIEETIAAAKKLEEAMVEISVLRRSFEKHAALIQEAQNDKEENAKIKETLRGLGIR